MLHWGITYESIRDVMGEEHFEEKRERDDPF
jgi:hypothetical protein